MEFQFNPFEGLEFELNWLSPTRCELELELTGSEIKFIAIESCRMFYLYMFYM